MQTQGKSKRAPMAPKPWRVRVQTIGPILEGWCIGALDDEEDPSKPLLVLIDGKTAWFGFHPSRVEKL